MDSEEKNTVWFQRRRKESFKIYCFCAARVGEHETCATGQILLVGNCAFPDNFFIERAIVFGRRSVCNRLCYYFNRLFVFPLYRCFFHLINRVVPNNPENDIRERSSEHKHLLWKNKLRWQSQGWENQLNQFAWLNRKIIKWLCCMEFSF